MSRLWFYGHARYDLWLSLDHDSSHEACSPAQSAILQWKEIKDKLKAFSFVPQGKTSVPTKFFGCNTYPFAKEWAQVLNVRAEGAVEKVDFKDIHRSSGQVLLSPGARWYQYTKAGAPLRLAGEGELAR